MKEKVFVTGATGFQGLHIAQHLIESGNTVVTLSRTFTNTDQIVNGVEVVTGSLSSETDLDKVFENVNKAVFTCPLVFDIETVEVYARNFITAAEKHNVDLVVYNSSFDLPDHETGLIALDIKVLIGKLFKASGLNVINLVPDIYLDNAAAPWSIPVILNNKVFPYPVKAGKKLPWISHADLGKFIALAINKPELSGETLVIGGNLVTGEDIAQAISNEVGEKIDFVSITPDDFQKEISPAFGEVAGQEISNLYRYLEKNSNTIVNKNFKKTQDLLGDTCQSLSDWAKSINWKV